MDAHRSRWNLLQGPAIMVYVDFATKKAWWVDLKANASYCPDENKSIILIPRRQRFGMHTVGELRKMRGFYDLDRKLDIIELNRDDLILGSFSTPLKKAANEYYRLWATAKLGETKNPSLGNIKVSRVGWRHITRRGRGLENIIQSWNLLGAARRIICENAKPYQIRKLDVPLENGDRIILHDYVSLRSRIIFPNRQEAVVQVVIKRRQIIDQTSGDINVDNWFYSVHEPRKGKKAQ
ncbi:MAG: DUF4365 domain-containing protein [Rectinemataceae bacterium]|nr:DUF4365 domain-containing protein [Rectinemataceae bacterium]